jgi:hypothetical protein
MCTLAPGTSLPRSAKGPLGPPSWGGRHRVVYVWSLVAARVRGLCTDTSSSFNGTGRSVGGNLSAIDQVWCGHGGRLPIVAYIVEDSARGVTLGYCDADSLQELRLLPSSCVRPSPNHQQPPPSHAAPPWQPLEVRLDDSDSRVELEANAAVVAKGNRDELQRRIHRRDGPVILAVRTCLGFN